jgi:hypothetical protein
MAKRTENIIRILETGSNVIVSSVAGKRRELLIEIAEAAVSNRVHVTFMGCEGWSTETLLAVATVGKKNVTFEV